MNKRIAFFCTSLLFAGGAYAQAAVQPSVDTVVASLQAEQQRLADALVKERRLASVRSDRYKRLARQLDSVELQIAQLQGDSTPTKSVADVAQ